MAHPDHSSQREGCLAEKGWDWEVLAVSLGLGMGKVPSGSEGEQAGSFYVHRACATCPVPAASKGQLTGAGLSAGGCGDEVGVDSLWWRFPMER